MDRAWNATNPLGQRGFQMITVSFKGPCFLTNVGLSTVAPPSITYVLRSPGISVPFDASTLFSYTNYPLIVNNCETYTLHDSTGTTVPPKSYISLNNALSH